ncbi:cocosin 1-like [Magnolia sinica]|uniref:cocosin 1-like n=1 Tax=Magnolia sinica TaxID=86752 RepID=UPI0026581E7D|nr:cocosin 1-like [Magnolia sinica]
MAKASFICLSLCLFLLCTGSLAQVGRREQQQQGQFSERSQCQIENLRALEPVRRVESEGGVMEFWDQKNEQLQCARMAVARQIIAPRGLHLPEYANAPRLLYIEQGSPP